MNETLPFTGERFVPECRGEISYEHWHRYAYARQLSAHRTVLDVACGEGYGSAMMAANADKVVGVDIAAAAIRHAKNRYGGLANLEYVEAACDKLPFADAGFDLAVSFETIEHIAAQKEFIAELARVLRPDGVLMLSSPNKRLYADARDYHNEFHVRELYRNELEQLLQPAFAHIRWFGQKLLFHSAIWPEGQACAATEYLAGDGQQVAAVGNPPVEPMYYIAVCSRNPALLPPALNRLSLFGDAAESVYNDYASQTRRVIELDGLLVERDAMLTLRTEQLAQHERQLTALNQQLDYRARLDWWLKSPLRFIKRALKADD